MIVHFSVLVSKCRLEHDKRYVHDEIGKILERERDASNDSLVKAVLRERTLTEEERMKSKHAVSRLIVFAY